MFVSDHCVLNCWVNSRFAASVRLPPLRSKFTCQLCWRRPMDHHDPHRTVANDRYRAVKSTQRKRLNKISGTRPGVVDQPRISGRSIHRVGHISVKRKAVAVTNGTGPVVAPLRHRQPLPSISLPRITSALTLGAMVLERFRRQVARYGSSDPQVNSISSPSPSSQLAVRPAT